MRPFLILAPLRGFTDLVFRNTFSAHFSDIDEAVSPFVTSIRGRRIKASHLADLSPADNRGLPLVPQILSNDAEEFLCLANTLIDLGYTEVNWNLGCPYPMVAKKMRGSGLLAHPETVDRLLQTILTGFRGRLSIKTRLGRFSADEMDALAPVFNRYPLERVIIHPRTGTQMYDACVDLDRFGRCLEQIVHPVVYNGDINDLSMYQTLRRRFERVSAFMLGRGLIANPFLGEMIQGRRSVVENWSRRFTDFHEELLEGYSRRFSGPGHVLDRMKGFWRYFALPFQDAPRILKRIRRVASLPRYRKVVSQVIESEVPWHRP